jgi:hypothetical protein|eukprot:COSAG03_NODE_4407_length_1563_cov_1.801230_2_plen_92_part_00
MQITAGGQFGFGFGGLAEGVRGVISVQVLQLAAISAHSVEGERAVVLSHLCTRYVLRAGLNCAGHSKQCSAAVSPEGSFKLCAILSMSLHR